MVKGEIVHRILGVQSSNRRVPHHGGCLCKVTSRQKSLKSSFVVFYQQNPDVFAGNVVYPGCRMVIV